MPTVLHVLPHPGGGGETYVDSLADMTGYRFDRFYLAPSSNPRAALRSLPRTALAVLLRARHYDLVHVHGEVAAAICLPSLATRPSVVTLHGLHLLRRAEGAAAMIARTNVRLVLGAADKVICVSDAERVDILNLLPKAEGRLAVIHNGVVPEEPVSDEERRSARAALDLSEAGTVGVWVGGLDAHKDPILALNAAIEANRSGTDFMLLIVGDGPLSNDIERRAALAHGAIRVLGYRKDVREVLAAADFFVLSSVREGLSYALLEAMSMGLPAVVSDAPGNPEAVGDTGLVFARGSMAEFATMLRKAATNPRARRALGARARARVIDHFSLEQMVSRTRDVYEAVRASRAA